MLKLVPHRIRDKMEMPGFWTQHRCPVCGVKGVSKIKRRGGELLGFCRSQRHPFSLERV